MKELFLISNSVSYGREYLDHCMTEVKECVGEPKQLLFIPYATHDLAAYTNFVKQRFANEGIIVTGINEGDPKTLLDQATAIFIGGGNTFRLLKTLQEQGLLPLIQEKVNSGTVYIGSSAGSNVAGPSIKTTNDMPIVEPCGFTALGLVPFQINPHFLDADPTSTHMGETRETRILEFLEENDTPVVGLREGGWIWVKDEVATIYGKRGARYFVKGQAALELKHGTIIPNG